MAQSRHSAAALRMYMARLTRTATSIRVENCCASAGAAEAATIAIMMTRRMTSCAEEAYGFDRLND